VAHVSLKDVAARSGVSFQTASKVLNGKGTVSAETRRRILAAADELGYVPNALARGLLSRRTRTIGVIASDFSDTVLSQVVVGVEREARRHGHGVIIASVDREGADGVRTLRTLIERRVDGIVAIAPKLEADAAVGELLRGRVAAVSTHDVAGGGVSVVQPDEVGAAFLASQHLVALGHRRIGTITGRGDRRVSHVRVHGYRRALAEAGIPFDPDLVEEGDWEPDGGYQAGHRLLDRAPDLSAVFVQNDPMAVGLLAALHDRGRRVPADCAVVGCDDLTLAARTIPPLTTVAIPFAETGETAARLLVGIVEERAGGGAPKPRRLLLPVRLVYRASSGRRDAGTTTGPPWSADGDAATAGSDGPAALTPRAPAEG
jgi:LacI family transcriptional regulator